MIAGATATVAVVTVAHPAPGFGALVALIGIIVVVWIVLRRRH